MREHIDKHIVKLDIVSICSEIITKKLNTHLNKEGIEYEKLKLGVQVIALNASKLIIILGLSIYFNIFGEVFVMLIVNSFIRHNAFGLHSKNPTICLVSTVLMFILPPILLKSVYLNNYIIVVIFLLFITLLYKYAPADTEKHPLLGENFRNVLKKKTLINAIILMFITLLISVDKLKVLIILSILYVIIGILPITYKLLKRRYHNYEEYE